jgi:hypothetical protein
MIHVNASRFVRWLQGDSETPSFSMYELNAPWTCESNDYGIEMNECLDSSNVKRVSFHDDYQFQTLQQMSNTYVSIEPIDFGRILDDVALQHVSDKIRQNSTTAPYSLKRFNDLISSHALGQFSTNENVTHLLLTLTHSITTSNESSLFSQTIITLLNALTTRPYAFVFCGRDLHIICLDGCVNWTALRSILVDENVRCVKTGIVPMPDTIDTKTNTLVICYIAYRS